MSSRLSKLCPNESVLSQSRHWLSGSDIRDDDSIGFRTFFSVFLAKNTKNKNQQHIHRLKIAFKRILTWLEAIIFIMAIGWDGLGADTHLKRIFRGF
jgi:hypothetical protein